MAKASAAKKKQAPADQIVSYDARAFVGRTSGPRYNPDDLVGARGLTTYRKMRIDEQVKAVCTFKRDAIFARGWCFEFESDSKLSPEEQQSRKDAFSRVVSRIEGSFVDGLNCVATGREFGYSVTEKVYTVIDGPDGSPIIGISKLLGRDPTTFTFETDEKGQLTRCYQDVAGKRTPIDLDKFIHYVHNPEFDYYFGRSDLREAYKAWFWKTKMMDYWMVYGERLAGGLAAAEVSADAGIQYNGPAWNALVQVMNDLSSVNSVVLPPGVTLNVTTPPNSEFYEKAVEFFDLAIARALLVPNLLGVSHTGQTGAFAQSQTQLEAFFWTLNTDKQRMESVLNEQLFRDIGDQNWGDGDYPCFKFKELSSERLKWAIDAWGKLVTGGAVLTTEADEKAIREMLEMPEREKGDKQLAEVKFKDPAEAALAQAKIDATKAGANPAVAPQQNAAPPAALTREDVQAAVREAFAANKPEPVVADRTKMAATVRAASRVHFSVISDRQNSAAQALVQDVAGQVAKNVKGLLGTDEELAATITTKVDEVADAQFTESQKRKLNATFSSALSSAYGLGQDMARNELHRAHATLKRQDTQAVPLIFADLRDKARDYFGAKAFKMAGDASDITRAIIQTELQNAVKYGKSPQEARKAIWDALIKKGLTNLDSVGDVEADDVLNYLQVTGEKGSAPYLETLARTNLFEAMNEARFAEFTDPAVADFVEGLEYSAILDDRTTDVCRALDDTRYRADSAVWDRYRPPNHYNCRSVLIPITTLDNWDGVESAPPSVQPQEGFK